MSKMWGSIHKTDSNHFRTYKIERGVKMPTSYNGKELIMIEITSILHTDRPRVLQEGDSLLLTSKYGKIVYTIVLDDEKIILRKVTK